MLGSIGVPAQIDGVEYALAHGADIVVNTDGDNQYPQDRIGDLVKTDHPRDADVVIADRQTQSVGHFSPFKKLMQRVGSQIVNRAANRKLPDAAMRSAATSPPYDLVLITVWGALAPLTGGDEW